MRSRLVEENDPSKQATDQSAVFSLMISFYYKMGITNPERLKTYFECHRSIHPALTVTLKQSWCSSDERVNSWRRVGGEPVRHCAWCVWARQHVIHKVRAEFGAPIGWSCLNPIHSDFWIRAFDRWQFVLIFHNLKMSQLFSSQKSAETSNSAVIRPDRTFGYFEKVGKRIRFIHIILFFVS